MTLDQLDRLLAEWKSTVDTIAHNLVELQNLPSYELLIGSTGSPKPKLSGATAQFIEPANRAIGQLMQQFGALSDLVGRAESLRKQVPRFLPGSDQKIAAILAILTNASLGAGNVTPAYLLAQIKASFDIAHNSLFQVDSAWKQLDAKLADAAAFLQQHSAEFATNNVRQQVEALRVKVIADPFGSNAEFDRDIQPELNRVRHSLETLIEQRANIQRDFERARSLLRQLSGLRVQAEDAYDECRQKITGFAPATPPVPADRFAAITAWLARLESNLAAGELDPVCTALQNWTSNVEAMVAAEARAAAENHAILALRRELRGRLSALRAKALARGVAEDIRLTQIAERAGSLLHARPTPLREASELVLQYEARLNGRA